MGTFTDTHLCLTCCLLRFERQDHLAIPCPTASTITLLLTLPVLEGSSRGPADDGNPRIGSIGAGISLCPHSLCFGKMGQHSASHLTPWPGDDQSLSRISQRMQILVTSASVSGVLPYYVTFHQLILLSEFQKR